MKYNLVDETTSKNADNVHLTRIYRLDNGEVVRVRIRRNFYEHQSYAVAEVLNSDRKWTDLVSEPADTWHAKRTWGEFPLEVLSAIATALARRAYLVLTGERV